MRFLRAFFLSFLSLAIFVTASNAEDPCDSQVIRSWEAQRETSAVRVVKLFLANASTASIREEGFELLRVEILLAPCIPPLRPEDFYLLNVHDPDPDLFPTAVLPAYLRKYGAPIDARDFFIGKSFWLEAE